MWFPALATTGVSVAFLSIVHPTFLMTALSGPAWNWYSSLATRYFHALDRIYYHWGIREYAPTIILLHAALIYFVLAMTSRVRRMQTPNGDAVGEDGARGLLGPRRS